MPRKSISGFAEAGAAMAQQLDDNDLLNLFSAVGRVVSKRFLMKRPCLDRWQLVLDYLTPAIGFGPRVQCRVLYLDKRNTLIALLGAGTAEVQLTLSSYLIGFAIGQVIYGPISDRYGRKPVARRRGGVAARGARADQRKNPANWSFVAR